MGLLTDIPIGAAEQPNFITRFAKNLGETALSIPLGLGYLAGTGVHDAYNLGKEAVTFGRADSSFDMPKTLGTMVKGFAHQSALPPFLVGDWDEARKRASDRPAEALLDFGGLAFGAARGAGMAGEAAARAGISPVKGMAISGHKPYADVLSPQVKASFDVELARNPANIFGTRRSEGVQYTFKRVGGEVFARPVTRKLDVQTSIDGIGDSFDGFQRRSSNELAAILGDFRTSMLNKLPEDTPIFGSMSRTRRFIRKHSYSRHTVAEDEMGMKNRAAEKVLRNRVEKLFPDHDDYQRKLIGDYTVHLAARGANKVDDYIMPWERTIQGILEGDTSMYDNLGAMKTRLQDELNAAVLELQELSGLTDIEAHQLTPWLKGEGDIFADQAQSRKLFETMEELALNDPEYVPVTQRIFQLANQTNRMNREYGSFAKFMDGIIETGDVTPNFRRRMENLDYYRNEINTMLRDKDMIPIMNHISDISQDSTTMMMSNMHFNTVFDPLTPAYRHLRYTDGIDTTLNNIDEVMAKSQAGETGMYGYRDAEGRIHTAYFVPAEEGKVTRSATDPEVNVVGMRTVKEKEPVKAYDPATVSRPTAFAAKASDEDYAMNPAGRILTGDDSWDFDVFMKGWKRQHFEFNNRLALEEAANVFGVYGADEIADRFGSDYKDIVAETDTFGRVQAVDESKPFVMVNTGSDLITHKRRLDEAMQYVSQHMDNAGLHSSAMEFSRFVNPTFFRMKGEEAAGRQSYVVIPRQIYDAFVADIAGSTNVAFRMLNKPTEIWKNTVLQLRPKWMINNAMGNAIMLTGSEGGFAGIASLIDNSTAMDKFGRILMGDEAWKSYRKSKGKYIEVTHSNGLKETIPLKQYLSEELPDLTASGSAWFWKGQRLEGAGTKLGKQWNTAMDWITDFNAKWNDDPYRLAKANLVVRRYVDELKQSDEAMAGLADGEIIIEMFKNPTIKRRILDEVLDDMVNYKDMGRREREIFAQFVVFWPWIKGSMKMAARQPYEHPMRLFMLRTYGEGAEERLREEYPHGVPSYMYANMPIGEDYMISGGGMSPYTSATDAASFGSSLIPFFGSKAPLRGSESPFGMLGPAPKAIVEGITREDLFFGTPFPKEGRTTGGLILERMFNIPQKKLIEDIAEPSPYSVREATPGALIASYMGMPLIAKYRPGVVAKRAADERREDLGK